jgi:NAD(P)-dependent dehydrogenase (short-subunit alcohol dehydrogenase family)
MLFVERGWNVVATMRAPEKADLPASPRLRLVRMDVTDRASIDAAIREGIAAFGGLDVVVNNAGIGLMAALEATPEKTIRELFETNTFGTIAVSQAVVPHFRERGAGTLVNVTSSATIVPMPLVSVYNATKSAIEGFTESLAYELSAVGVRAKLVEPGFSPHTSFVANSSERMSGLVSEPYASYGAQLMSGMSGAKTTSGADVANAVWLAATDGSKRLRYAAGPDAEEMAALRRAQPGDDYLETMRAAVGPR